MWGGAGEGSQGLTPSLPKVCDLSKSINLGTFVQKNQSRKALMEVKIMTSVYVLHLQCSSCCGDFESDIYSKRLEIKAPGLGSEV